MSGKPRSKTYDGQCHCGQVKFTVKMSPPIEDGPVTNCNCSICSINGYLMVYPLETNITWHSNVDDLAMYKFGPERIAHFFCRNCGTSMGGKSTDPNHFADHRAINVRTLKGIDMDGLKLRKVDNRDPAQPSSAPDI